MKGVWLMQKFAVLLLAFLCLSFNVVKVYAAPKNINSTNVYTEGLYKPFDLNIIDTNVYRIQNISQDKSLYVAVYNENQETMQAIRLAPNSRKYELIPMKPEYRIIVVGGGQLYINVSSS